MLIDTFNENDIITLKMTSGEEVIARLVERKENDVVVIRPMVLGQTQQGMGLLPFVFTVDTDRNLSINNSTVVVIAKTDSETASQYIQATTGLTLATNNENIHNL